MDESGSFTYVRNYAYFVLEETRLKWKNEFSVFPLRGHKHFEEVQLFIFYLHRRTV